MRVGSALPGILLAGCAFHPGATSVAAGDGGADAGDGGIPGGDGGDAGIDGAAFVLCDPGDLDLRACYTFDGDAKDGSSYRNDASASGVTYVAGVHGSAVATGAGSSITVGSDPSLAVTSITIKMSIRPTTLPAAGARYGLLDSSNRYRMFLQPGGALRCALTNGADLTTSTGVISAGTWARVACTFDGTTMKIYKDGTLVDMLTQPGSIQTTSGGMVLGQNSPSGDIFDGAIDDLQLWGSIVAP